MEWNFCALFFVSPKYFLVIFAFTNSVALIEKCKMSVIVTRQDLQVPNHSQTMSKRYCNFIKRLFWNNDLVNFGKIIWLGGTWTLRGERRQERC